MNGTERNLKTTETHLTDDQIDAALIGGAGAEVRAHLNACAMCTARLAEAEMPLASFKAVSSAWSERRSATMPAVVPHRSGMGAQGRLLAWSAALSVMIAAGVAAPVLLRQDHGPAEDRQAAKTLQTATQGYSTAAGSSVFSGTTGGLVASNAHGKQREEVSGGRSQQNAVPQDNRTRDNIILDNAMLRDIDRELDASTATPAVLDLERPPGPLTRPQTVNE